jgi:hypothetical protein
MASLDGGKGSARRKEDSQAVRDNWDRIFGKKEDKPMIDEDDDIDNDERDHDEEDDSEWCCDRCGGPMYRQPHWGYARCDDCGARQELINDDYT